MARNAGGGVTHAPTEAASDQRSDPGRPCFLYAVPRSADRVHFGKTRRPRSRSRTHERTRKQITLEGLGWQLWWMGNENEEGLLHRFFQSSLVDGEREEFWRSPDVTAFLERMARKPYVAHSVSELEECYPTQDWFPWSERHLYEAEQMVLVDGYSRAYVPRDAAPGNGHTSLREDYYTPAEHIACVRAAMDGIDLDPASSPLANKTVGARHIFTRAENGLVQPWEGRVFMNPPYGDEAPRWVAKLLMEFHAGRIEQAIALLRVGAASGVSWFPPLWEFPLCFLPQRIKFVDPLGGPSSPDHGSVFVALGIEPERFAAAFLPLGGRVFVPLEAS